MKNFIINSIILIVSFFMQFLLVGESMADIPLQKIFLRSTVYVENSFGSIGTGFLVSKKTKDNKYLVFVITNKHMLQSKDGNKYCEYIDIRFYKKDTATQPKVKIIRIIIKNNEGISNRVFFHPEESIDIAAIFVSDQIENEKEIEWVPIPEELFLTRNIMKEEVIEAGEDVLVLGYPAGIFSQENFLPLVKRGIIASPPQEDLKLRLGDKIIQGKMILVEASLFGGSSGSPVFVKPRWKVKINPETKRQEVQLGQGMPLYLVGIQSSAIELKEKIYTHVLQNENSLNNNQNKNKEINPTAVVKKDAEGEYFEISKEVNLNIIFSSEYIYDLFKECDKRFPENGNKEDVSNFLIK